MPPSTTCWHFVQVLVNHRWPSRAKNRSQHWENSRLDRLRFRHMPHLACRLFCYSDSALLKKVSLKSFLNAKVKSLTIKCINHGFRSNGHCQSSRPRCTLLCCDPHVSLKPRAVTHFKLTVPPLQKSLIHIMNTFWKRIECRIQRRMKWTILLTFSK